MNKFKYFIVNINAAQIVILNCAHFMHVLNTLNFKYKFNDLLLTIYCKKIQQQMLCINSINRY